MPEIDFGFNGNKSVEDTTVDTKPTDDVEDIDSGKIVDPNTGYTVDEITDDKPTEESKDKKPEKTEDVEEETSLEKGTIIEYNDKKYTVNDNGDLVDEEGNIFKEAKKVNNWLKSVETEEVETDNNEINISTIQKTLGIEITDENGKPIEFENTPEGVASYVNAYLENTKEQIIEDTIDKLYSKYPILENVINYYVANGNSLEGFNEMKDRSNITLDINNENQCEAIIREAWKEENRKGNVDTYIQYLKSQNLLGATAEEELQAMVKRDKDAADELARTAAETERKEIERQRAYWTDVQKRVITDKRIGKYQIPDTIIRVRNGQKTSATPQDFYNYIYQVDKNGRSQYENELIKEATENPESRLVDDMIAAYLKFTGGNYESLINMAINEQKVKTIKIMSKKGSKAKGVKVNPPANKSKDIDLGY